jgi:redox-sensitive bicupin YhaK (pirin superfamily)
MHPIAALIHGRATDLGDGMTVLRALPQATLRSIGPFVFVDHIGPAELPAGRGLDVRPHPHIGLATVTWLFDGEILHRDSLGTVQAIAPGDVNWMVAGRGIVHSERTATERRRSPVRLHGMQTWLALPAEREDDAPAFEHHPAATLPTVSGDGTRLTVIAGEIDGLRSPVGVYSPTLYAALELAAGGRYMLAAGHVERAVYVAAGEALIGAQRVARGTLAVLAPGVPVALSSDAPATLMLLGGAPLGPRFVWWNLVSSSREKIDAARAEWARHGDPGQRQRFGSVPGELEFIPLPER